MQCNNANIDMDTDAEIYVSCCCNEMKSLLPGVMMLQLQCSAMIVFHVGYLLAVVVTRRKILIALNLPSFLTLHTVSLLLFHCASLRLLGEVDVLRRDISGLRLRPVRAVQGVRQHRAGNGT